MLFKCTGLVVTFRLLCFEMPTSQRQGAKRHLAEQTHTHTHILYIIYEMFEGHCHSTEAVQPEHHAFFWARQEVIRAKSGFDLHSTHVCVFGSDVERHGLNY